MGLHVEGRVEMLAPIRALDAGRAPENVKYSTKNGWGGAPFPCTPRDGVPGAWDPPRRWDGAHGELLLARLCTFVLLGLFRLQAANF